MHIETLQHPAAEPLDIAVLRDHLKVDGDDQDALIAAYLSAARDFCQQVTGQQLVAAKLRLVLDDFPRSLCWGDLRKKTIQIPKSPIIKIDTITYIDENDNEQIFSSSDYVLANRYIGLKAGKIWPCTARQGAAVRIDFWAGYCAPFHTSGNTLILSFYPDLAVGDRVKLSNSGGELPKPLKPSKVYTVKTVEGVGIYTLSETADGDAITLTTTGTGIHYLAIEIFHGIPEAVSAWLLLRAESHFTMRGENAIVRGGTLSPLPFADHLLDPFRLPSF